MKQILKVKISDKNEYLIEISDSSFEELNKSVFEYTNGQKRLVIMSKKIYKLYSDKLNFDDDEIFIFPDGEKEKNYNNYLKILKRAYKMNLSRKDVIIAVGGGVIGDIAGFAASTYMRGIDFIQIPTTLLAAVDSSVGEKLQLIWIMLKISLELSINPKRYLLILTF